MATQIQRRPAVRARARAAGAPESAKRRAHEKWKSLTVDATPEECYADWRDVRKLAGFLSFVRAVEPTGEKWSHWIGKEGDENTAGWDADLVDDAPGRALEWQPLAHGSEPVAVSVRFDRATGGRGTVVRLSLRRKSKAEPLRADRELHRFKQWKETGEIATTEGQPAGRRGPMGRLLRKGEQ
jgi:uncharacterized membrane protein